MKSIHEAINDIPTEQWNYYNRVLLTNDSKKPFVDHSNYSAFIKNYFMKGGKVEVFESCNIEANDLRLPNHICSVFFLGVLLYNNTSLKNKYRMANNDPGYRSFPFIWFLIALFHDNAYQMEGKTVLTGINTLTDLYSHFNIEHPLLKTKCTKCKALTDAREKYFNYRKKHWGVVDHGILGGVLLYDRLVKIRRKKKEQNEDNLFWGKKLENQYKLAANAISLHNIWIPVETNTQVYKQHELTSLLNFEKVRSKDFPLFYLLGIVDTIEPLKVYKEDDFEDSYILQNLTISFERSRVQIANRPGSLLNFEKMLNQLKYFDNWLDLEIRCYENSFELKFK